MKKDREDYRFYRIWGDMNYRCNTPTCRAYKNYGAKGILVCDKWRKYRGFYEDMWGSYTDHVKQFGEKQTTLDRIDSNGNYELNNCRWATYSEQRLNIGIKEFYIGTRLSDGFSVLFNNKTKFCAENNFCLSSVTSCIYLKRKSHKGWTFRLATEEERIRMVVHNERLL